MIPQTSYDQERTQRSITNILSSLGLNSDSADLVLADVSTILANTNDIVTNITNIAANITNIAANTISALDNTVDILEEVIEIERHLHGGARWFGASAGPAAPGLITSLLPWRATSSATGGAFGTAIEIFNGAEDFDISTTVTYFDPHQLFIIAVEAAGTYKFRFANSQYDGVSTHAYANMAAAIAAKKYTEIVFRTDDTKTEATPIDVMSGRCRAGSKLWCQVAKDTANAKYVDFLIGLHTYAA